MPTETVDERQRYSDEGTDLVFEWGTLFDSVALGVSYLWLCCGVIVFVLIPIIFIVLWVASRRRNQQQEE
jgi:heme/copper-type cytochrome/quinol oxidase subunit 2